LRSGYQYPFDVCWDEKQLIFKTTPCSLRFHLKQIGARIEFRRNCGSGHKRKRRTDGRWQEEEEVVVEEGKNRKRGRRRRRRRRAVKRQQSVSSLPSAVVTRWTR
jgi:hypothetical protein